jgi:hypothetical protein
MTVWHDAEGAGLDPVPVPLGSPNPLPGTYIRHEDRCPLCLRYPLGDEPPGMCAPCRAAIERDPWLSRDPAVAAVSPAFPGVKIPAHIHRAVNAQARQARRRLERAARLAALVPVEELDDEPPPAVRGQQLGLWV